MSLDPPGLSALLPLKLSGRHYGDNLARLDLLFSSLAHHGSPGWLDELVVVARADEIDAIRRHLARWPELPLRIVAEDEHFPAFRRFNRPWQLRPWQRQQIIKLNARALTSSPFVLTLDPDVIAVKPIRRETLLPGGRALLEPESRSVHPRWWRDSADLLNVDPGMERPGMTVTPALISIVVLDEVHRRLEEVGGRPWMDILLTSYCDWTEYTLYLLAAERAGLLAAHHVWADDSVSPTHLQTEPEVSIWDAGEVSRADLGRLFASDVPGMFAVVQSNTGLKTSEVTTIAAKHFAVRRVSTGSFSGFRGRSRLEERFHTTSRLAAQQIYRLRRRLRGGRRPPPGVAAPGSVRHGRSGMAREGGGG